MSETRARILEAARGIYLEEGPEAVTMRRVAARVGITATALYRHFLNKEALVEAVIGHGFQVFGGYLHRALAGATPGERLKLSGGAYLDFALEQPEIYRTVFMTPSREGGWPGAGGRDTRKQATFRFLVDRVDECMRSGEVAAGDPEATALTLWAHVHGLVSLYIAGAVPGPEAAFRATYSDSLGRLFAGLHG
jgi:AcrR family transcriptional regulator